MRATDLKGAVFFDFDGVLVDTEPIYFDTLNKLVVDTGKPPLTREDYGQFIGKPTSVTWSYLASRYGFEDSIKYQQSIYRDILRDALQERMVLRDGMLSVFESSEVNHLGSVLVTSGNKEWTDYKLNLLGLENYFDCVVTGDDVVAAKPSPEIYLLAARRSGFEIASSLAIEDSISGIESAKMAGLFTVGLRTELTSSLDLSLADILVDKLDEVDLISIIGMIESKHMAKR
tara:strand:+ start:44 stop:736 length:693 start_codon:yes stop_codon:yes gene_type:complete